MALCATPGTIIACRQRRITSSNSGADRHFGPDHADSSRATCMAFSLVSQRSG